MRRLSKIIKLTRQAIREAHQEFWQDIRRILPWAILITIAIMILRYHYGTSL